MRVKADYSPSDGDVDGIYLYEGDVVEIVDHVDETIVQVVNRSLGAGNGLTGNVPVDILELDGDQEVSTVESEKQSLKHSDKQSSASASPAPSINTTDSTKKPSQQPKNLVPPGSKYIARFEYQAQREDELSLKVDDIIYILASPEGGWWRGMRGPAGKQTFTGWFPANYVEEFADSSSIADTQTPHPPQERQKSWYQKIMGHGGTIEEIIHINNNNHR